MATFAHIRDRSMAGGVVGFLNRYFYFCMSLVIAGVVVYGFGHTVDQSLIHAVPARPWVLWLHGAVFSGWVLFLILQTSLVRVRKVAVHKTLGWFGVAWAAAMVVVGLSTSVTMDRFDLRTLHQPDVVPFLAIQLSDLTSFAVFVTLAILWRRKPEYHRRAMVLASCVLTAAAFSRFPWISDHWFYLGVDSLVLMGIARDWIVMRRVHPVYLFGLQAMVVVQAWASYAAFDAPAWWMRIAGRVVY
jgi:hypothetical protein